MSKGFKLLRVEYLFSVLIPCLLAIYLNDYDISQHLWILAGFGFYAITGNTLNDVIDMKNPKERETLERVKGYSRKEIGVLAIASFSLGTMCFMNDVLTNPLLGVYLVIIIFMVIFYCLFKFLVILNHIILGVSHIILPFFMIKINAGDIVFGFLPGMELNESLILASITAVAFLGQWVHEMIDDDSLAKLKPKTSQIVIWVASIISLIIAIISFIITFYFIFLPIIFFPVGIMYIFRKSKTKLIGRTSLKDIGIILGNLMFAYIIILIFAT
ncbi:MAG: UbiA family prenyltransferase [Promethearchaeota archaeon]|jgi:4-hydroxybenzoate polyprenyltransferase